MSYEPVIEPTSEPGYHRLQGFAFGVTLCFVLAVVTACSDKTGAVDMPAPKKQCLMSNKVEMCGRGGCTFGDQCVREEYACPAPFEMVQNGDKISCQLPKRGE
jgi:hypothetical protein